MNSCSLGEELQKNKEMVKELDVLNALRKWISGEPSLPTLERNDLILFWLRNKYNFYKTKENIEYYFFMRASMPAFFTNRSPIVDSLVETLSTVCIITLPNRTPDGYAVVFMRLLNTNPARFDFCQAVKYLNMVIDFHVYLEGTSKGYLFVCDLKGISLAHLSGVPKRDLSRYFEYLKRGAQFQWKGMHFINTSSKCGYMNEYIKRMIATISGCRNVLLHTNKASLMKIVPRQILPDEIGGRAGNMNELHQAQIKKMKEYSAWFEVEERMRPDGEDNVDGENDMDEINQFNNNGNSIF